MNTSLLFVAIIALCITFASAATFQQAAPVSSSKCELCKFLVKEVQKELDNHIPNTKSIVDKVCGYFPAAAQNACDNMLTNVVNQMIELLKAGETAEKVCELVSVCDKTSFLRKMTSGQATEMFLTMNKQFNSNGTCSMCKMIIQKAENLIHDNEDEVEKKLLGVCKLLDGSLTQLCDTIVVLYGPQIIDYILTNGDPSMLCHKIGLCKDTVVPEIKEPVQPEELKSGGCAMCKYVIGVVEDYIKDDKSQDAVVAALDKVCDLLPGALKGQCTALVTTYEPLIVQYLVQNYPPGALCKAIGVCDSAAVASKLSDAPFQPAAPAKSDSQCGLCKLVVGYVEQFLQDKKSQDQIEKSLEKVCHFLPGTFATQCDTLVELYLPQIIQMLTNKYPAAEVCKKIHLCEA